MTGGPGEPTLGVANYVLSAIQPAYGSRTPLGGVVFIRMGPRVSRGQASIRGMPGMFEMGLRAGSTTSSDGGR